MSPNHTGLTGSTTAVLHARSRWYSSERSILVSSVIEAHLSDCTELIVTNNELAIIAHYLLIAEACRPSILVVHGECDREVLYLKANGEVEEHRPL